MFLSMKLPETLSKYSFEEFLDSVGINLKYGVKRSNEFKTVEEFSVVKEVLLSRKELLEYNQRPFTQRKAYLNKAYIHNGKKYDILLFNNHKMNSVKEIFYAFVYDRKLRKYTEIVTITSEVEKEFLTLIEKCYPNATLDAYGKSNNPNITYLPGEFDKGFYLPLQKFCENRLRFISMNRTRFTQEELAILSTYYALHTKWLWVMPSDKDKGFFTYLGLYSEQCKLVAKNELQDFHLGSVAEQMFFRYFFENANIDIKVKFNIAINERIERETKLVKKFFDNLGLVDIIAE